MITSSLAPFQKAQIFIGHPQERERWSCRSVAAHAHEVVAVSLRPSAGVLKKNTWRWIEMRGGRKNRVQSAAHKNEKRAEEKRKDALVLLGGVLDTDGLDADVQGLFRCKDGGTVEVHRWINDVQWNAFRGIASVQRR